MVSKKIGVVSDTHIPRKAKVLPGTLLEGLKGVDMIIHAGDINRDHVVYELEELAPVIAVAGNTDDDFIRDLFGRRKVITVEGVKIGVVHGDGDKGTTLERAKKEFVSDGVNCVVFGHSHVPFNEMSDGILFFNPGSPTDRRRQEAFSYGILTVENCGITGEIKYFK